MNHPLRGIVLVTFAIGLLPLSAPADDGEIVGAWHFDGDARDSGEYALHGKILHDDHVRFVPGRVGQAIAFSGEEGRFGSVTMPKPKVYDFSRGMTVTAWVRFNDAYEHRGTYYIATNGDWRGPGWRLLIFYNKLAFQSGDGKTMWGAMSTAADHSFDRHRWYHVAATYDGGRFRVYINGRLCGENKTEKAMAEGKQAVTVGSFGGGKTAGFAGDIDEFRIYTGSLPSLEIVKAARLGASDSF